MRKLGAIEAGGTKFVYGIANENGNILERHSKPTTENPQETLSDIITYFQKNSVEYLGVASFGPIDLHPNSESYGFITNTPKKGWGNFALIPSLQKALNIPVAFDSDVNAAILGEATWGAAKGIQNAIYLTIGTGIGGGALVEGSLVHGALHPEMGHISLPFHAKDPFKKGCCPFHTNCFEGLASGPSLEIRWGKAGKDLPSSHIAWDIEVFYIASALSSYILTLSPEKIILGGGVMKQLTLFPKIRKEVQQILGGYVQIPELISEIDNYIVPPKLQDNAGLLGAIALII